MLLKNYTFVIFKTYKSFRDTGSLNNSDKGDIPFLFLFKFCLRYHRCDL